MIYIFLGHFAFIFDGASVSKCSCWQMNFLCTLIPHLYIDNLLIRISILLYFQLAHACSSSYWEAFIYNVSGLKEILLNKEEVKIFMNNALRIVFPFNFLVFRGNAAASTIAVYPY